MRAATIALPDGRRLGYAEYGDAAGAPVFSFHGLPGSRLQSARYHDAAARCGARIIAPDRPGIGLSDPLPGRRLLDWPADVAALAGSLGVGRFAVFGCSGGSPYALACARAMPSRLTRVLLVSPLAPLDAPDARRAHPLVMRMAAVVALRSSLPLCAAFRCAAWMTRIAPARAVALAARSLPECDRALLLRPAAIYLAARDQRVALANDGRGACQDALALARPWGFPVEEIAFPVDVWHGERDTIARPDAVRSLAGALPKCRARCFPDEGHYLMLARGEEMMRWLAG